MTRPVPFSLSTFSSGMMGTSTLNSGVSAFLPAYRAASSGWHMRATQAGMSSGRVVITGACRPSMVKRMTFCVLAISLSTISAWAMAVWSTGVPVEGLEGAVDVAFFDEVEEGKLR